MATILNQVRLATLTNVNLSVALITGTSKIDGVLTYGNDRVLVKAQTNKVENGIYLVNATTGVLTRATDFANASVQTPSTIVFVQEGETLADTGWTISSNGTLTVGSSEIEFEKFSNNLKLAGYDVTSSIILRGEKGYPLTIDELDNNFKYLSSTLDTKFNAADFTPTAITDKINSIDASVASLDAWQVRGLNPSESSSENTVVTRDEFSDIYTNIFHGDLEGNATTASLSDFAALAGNVNGIVAVLNGGTGSSNSSGARMNIGAVNISGDTMLGKLNFAAANLGYASINIPPRLAIVTDPINGDIWTDTSFIQYKLNNTIQTVASLNSPTFVGAPTVPTASKISNSTAIASTAFVQLHVADLNVAINLKASIASPTLTGAPKSVTPATADNSTNIATTAYVVNRISSVLPDYYTKVQANALFSAADTKFTNSDTTLQAQINELKLMKGIPVGSVIYYAANSTPMGWLHCNGGSFATTAYPQLFAKIGYTYGGSGTTFKLPDLRGEFIRGFDDQRGVDPGRVFGSSQKSTGIRILLDKYAQGLGAGSQYPDGALAITGSNIDGFSGFETNSPELMRYPGSGLVNVSSNSNFITAQAVYSAGSGDNISFLTRPRNVAMMPCIKAFGDIDSPELVSATAVLVDLSNKLDKRGDVMTGALTLSGNPTLPRHAATKEYVDTYSALTALTITYGNTQYSQSGFTNQVGSFNDGANWFDVYPPAGKTMSNLAAFMPSIAMIHYAGGVDVNDSLRCTWANLGDRIRVWVQNTEQRSTPAANWIAFWR